ncbi:uncharacterized protein LOC135138306 isoform X2 [Zophobas morio]|uniref:uncharacterized protein LOC135138306 isoform X2 n=1 Tax=Zophobas morio TaxID=2755281 RepID=UPI003082C7E5
MGRMNTTGNLQVAKNEGTRSSLQVARHSSAEKQNEHRHFQANFLRNSQTFSPVYNFYETYNQSWHYNYTSPRQSQPVINNILVNVDSRFGLGCPSLPRASGGCGCRQIQCADRRCGCNKAGTPCHGGCLCSSRGSWCLNR